MSSAGCGTGPPNRQFEQIRKVREAVQSGDLEKAEQEFRLAAKKAGPWGRQPRDPSQQGISPEIPPAARHQKDQASHRLRLNPKLIQYL
jgi:hypothetical protein